VSLAAINSVVLRKVALTEELIREDLTEGQDSWVSWALEGKVLAKEGWEEVQQDSLRMLEMLLLERRGQPGVLPMRLQGQPEMLLAERQGQ